MAQDTLKRSAAEAALNHIESGLTRHSVIGIGTGSTANFFIDALAGIRHKFDAAVASSESSAPAPGRPRHTRTRFERRATAVRVC